MKFLLSFVLLISPLFADTGLQDEIAVLQELIATTKKNLESQQHLLNRVIKFKQARAAFMADPTSGQLATRLVKSAMLLQKNLEKEHLAHLFSSDFLTELAFFDQIGNQHIP